MKNKWNQYVEARVTNAAAELKAREDAPMQYFLYTLPVGVVYCFCDSFQVMLIASKETGKFGSHCVEYI